MHSLAVATDEGYKILFHGTATGRRKKAAKGVGQGTLEEDVG